MIEVVGMHKNAALTAGPGLLNSMAKVNCIIMRDRKVYLDRTGV